VEVAFGDVDRFETSKLSTKEDGGEAAHHSSKFEV